MNKPWARLRKHGPCAIFDWHETEEMARAAIHGAAERNGDQVYKFQTVAYFPDENQGTAWSDDGSCPILLEEYREAVNGVGPLAYEWADKPHRLIYALCLEVERLRKHGHE